MLPELVKQLLLVLSLPNQTWPAGFMSDMLYKGKRF
jgi:hypothetical protein